MRDSGGTSLPKDRYWWLDPGEKLVRHLARRRKEYCDFLVSSGLQERIKRNYNYFHGNFNDLPNAPGDMAIRQNTASGNVFLGMNEFRPLVEQLAILTTENPPAWDTMARVSNHRAMEQTIIGNDILDYEMDGPHHMEEVSRAVVVDALVFTAGYSWDRWDHHAGKQLGAALGGAIEYEGDLRHSNPNFYQVLYPWERPWREKEWVVVWNDENVWDLVALYPDKREEILNARTFNPDLGPIEKISAPPPDSDSIEVMYAYHIERPSLPYGRMIKAVGSDVVLEDTYSAPERVWDGEEIPEELPAPGGEGDQNSSLMWSDAKEEPEPAGWKFLLPIHRVIPSRYLLTSAGYTIAFDLQGFQEALNGEISTILNNHKNFAQLRIWANINDQVNSEQLDAGSTLVRSSQKPEALNLLQPIPEAFDLITLLRGMGEAISGVNAVSRGIPTDKANSGVALALIDQKSQQSASNLIAAFNQYLCDVGTATLQIYQAHASSPRAITATSGSTRTAIKEFTSSDLDLIERVAVKVGNPLSRTTAGRFEIARFLAEGGYIKNREEIINVLNTGQYRPLMRAEMSELAIVGDENERLSRGEPVRASPLDNQMLHIREHHATLDSTEVREDERIGGGVEVHIEQHIDFLRNPKIAEMQAILGFEVPPFLLQPPGPPPGDLGGGMPPMGGPPPAGPMPPGRGPKPAAVPPGLSVQSEPTGQSPAGMPHLPVLPDAVVQDLKDAALKAKVIR